MNRPFNYRELTKLMSDIGFSVTEHDVKNGNKGKVYDNLVPFNPKTELLVMKLKQAIPELDTTKIFIS
jgi:hypothetical protein